MHFLSGLGDSRLVLTGAAATVGVLAGYRQLGVARRFLIGLACCIGAIAAAKLVGLSLAGLGVATEIGSPSGHVALSAIFVGSLALLGTARQHGAVRALVLAGAVALVLAVGYERIANDAHTPFEVVEGLLIGALCLAPLALARTDLKTTAIPIWPLVAILAAPPAFRALVPAADLDTESVVMEMARHIVATVGGLR